jgi:HK97 family phage major capsid protein
MSRIRSLEGRRADAIKAARALTTVADAAGRDLSAEEQTAFDNHMAQAASLKAQIDGERALELAEAGLNASGGVTIPANASIKVTENVANDPKRGYKSLGEFAVDVKNAAINGQPSQRLTIGAAAPSTFGNEASGVDGGFLIPPDFATEVFNLSLLEDSLLPMVDNITVDGNSMAFPKDETTPWGTDGVRAYWQSEGTAATATKPKFGTTMMRLHKLLALVPLTDELLTDTNALNSYLPNLMSRSIRWKTNEAFITGTGAGQPEGMFTGAAAVTVTKDSGQAANTISVLNLTNMLARLPPGSLSRAVWMITPDAIPSLLGLTIGNVPAFLPLNQPITGKVNWMLFGLPVMISQHVAAFSAAGDIRLVDGSYYRAITKAGGIETASSMHLYFDADATAFRTTFRVDGQPKLAAAIAQAKGSNTLSPFVQLGAR